MENAIRGQAIPFWMDFPKRDALFVGACPAEGRQLAVGIWRSGSLWLCSAHPNLDELVLS